MGEIRFDDRVAIVTGAGVGLGRSHALELAQRGAKVVVNDLGGSVDGAGGSSAVAEAVVAEIIAAGGEAIAHGANVCNPEQVQDMVAQTMAKWGRIDILVNNAGILRDKTFAKMEQKDFQMVVDVHLMGTMNCTKAVWQIMRDQNYGRIAMTTSSSGTYGNFGQSNYGAAKMAVVGFMNVLCLEGAKYDIRVNALSPTAATRMTEDLPGMQGVLDYLTVESVTAGLIPIVAEDSPNRTIMCAGAGGYAATRIYETQGIYLKPEDQTAENVMARMDEILDANGQEMYTQGGQQSQKFVVKAMEAAKG